MATDAPVTVTISAQQANLLKLAADRSGLDAQELVERAIERTYGSESQVTPEQDESDASAEDFRNLMRELAAMPVEHPQDTLGGRDHDRILYGRDS